MGYKFKILSFLLIFCSLFMVGCTEKKKEVVVEKNPGIEENEEFDLSKLPMEVSKFSELEKGFTEDFKSLDEDAKNELLKELKIKSNEESYLNLLKVFQQEYEPVDKLMDKLKFSIEGFEGEGRYAFKDNLNVLILLDASGSMGKTIGGESQMTIAKRELSKFVKSLPAEANVGLRVYGHKGKGTDEEKELSCSSSELIYGLDKYNESVFTGALNNVNPSGWTPTELAINEASKDLDGKTSEDNTNIIYLVSDGISTCNDNPVEAAKKLYESDLKPVINVIGFNVDAESKAQLEEVTKVTEGQYQDANNAIQLSEQFKEVEEMANKWKEWLSNVDKELDSSSKLNLVDIFNYAARVQQNVVKTNENVLGALDYLKETEEINEKEYNTLLTLHEEYISIIEEKVADLRSDLRSVNTENYSSALEEVEKILYGSNE